MKKNSYLTVTDQFCGAGGSSIGAAAVGFEVVLALNHWELAIETHNTNFPDTFHDMADVSATDPRRYPSTDILITSPECTNHSVAKGAKRRQRQMHLWEKEKVDPAAERSRATMWDVPRYAEYHDYNMIVVENVVDARAWVMWDAWIHAMNSLGYDYHIVYFNSMFAHLDPSQVVSLHDFAPQSRDRMYVVFWKKGNHKPDLDFRPMAHCSQCDRQVGAVQSWKQTAATRQYGGRWGRYGTQYVYCCPHCANEVEPYYYAAANIIDWSLPAERIGDRKRPLAKKTIQRIEKGLEMFAGQHLVIDLAYSHGHDKRSVPISASLPTQTTVPTNALLLNLLHGETVRHAGEAMATQTTRQSVGLAFYLGYVNGDAPPRSVNDPLLTLATRNTPGLAFLSVQYTPGYNKRVDEPLASVTTQDHHALIGVPFIATARGTNLAKGVDDVLDSFVAGGTHHGLVVPFLSSLNYYDDRNVPMDAPMPTQTTQSDKFAFVMSHYGTEGQPRALDREMPTIPTKDKHSLVMSGTPHVDDCHFRMLQPHEIGAGMAFPNDYVVLGNKREQVRQYGNAVTPPVMKMLLERCAATFQ